MRLPRVLPFRLPPVSFDPCFPFFFVPPALPAVLTPSETSPAASPPNCLPGHRHPPLLYPFSLFPVSSAVTLFSPPCFFFPEIAPSSAASQPLTPCFSSVLLRRRGFPLASLPLFEVGPFAACFFGFLTSPAGPFALRSTSGGYLPFLPAGRNVRLCFCPTLPSMSPTSFFPSDALTVFCRRPI